MIRNHVLFGVCFVLALTGCLGSMTPIADSSETDDALLGGWHTCQGGKIEITRPNANERSSGYAMKVIDRQTHKPVTYRLIIQNIGGEEFIDAFYAPRHLKVDEFVAVHVIALIRHEGNDVLIRPMNDEWWNEEHLKGSGLQLVEAGDETHLIVGKSFDLRTFLGAHAHDPDAFLEADEGSNDGRLKRQWAAAEAEGCNEEL